MSPKSLLGIRYVIDENTVGSAESKPTNTYIIIIESKTLLNNIIRDYFFIEQSRNYH